MALTPTPVYPQSLVSFGAVISNSTGISIVPLTLTQPNGAKIESIVASSSDTTARDLMLYATSSGTNYQMLQVQIPSTAGFADTVPPVNVLKGGITPGSFPGMALDSNGNPYIYLPSGSVLSLSAATSIGPGKQMNIFATGGAF